MNTVAIDAQLPKLTAHAAIVDYSGCCAIYANGTLVGNGALLWTGQHIITAARVVDGVSLVDLTFRFNTHLLYTVPSVASVTIHPDYNYTTKFYEHNIAIITLSSQVSETVTRYNPRLKSDAIMKTFTRCVYGRELNPLTGEYTTI